MGKKLLTAVDGLAPYFAGTGRTDLLTLALGGMSDLSMEQFGGTLLTGMQSEGITLAQRQLMMVLLDNAEGGRFIKDVVKSYEIFAPGKDAAADEDIFNPDMLCVIHEPETADLGDRASKVVMKNASIKEMCRTLEWNKEYNSKGRVSKFEPEYVNGHVNQTPDSPDRVTAPSLAAFVFPMTRIGLQNRDMDVASLFCNSIPALEFSKAVPYIKTRFIFEGGETVTVKSDASGESTTTDTGDKNMTMLNFLRAGAANGGDMAGMSKGVYGDQDPIAVMMQSALGDDEDFSITMAGNELFSSPQTLLNLDRDGFLSDDTIIHKTRPFLTLQSLGVNVTAAGRAFISSTRASLKLKLHDKSRLKEIAPLVSTSEFGRTQVLIEFGWDHPDESLMSNNAYGQLIGSLRHKGYTGLQPLAIVSHLKERWI